MKMHIFLKALSKRLVYTLLPLNTIDSKKVSKYMASD
eukprot:UN07301